MPLTCPSCGQANRDDASFCQRCGTPLTTQAHAERAAQMAEPAPEPATSEAPAADPSATDAPAVPPAADEAPPPVAPEAGPPGSGAAEAPAGAEPGPEEYRLTHRGQVFGIGYGPEIYAVWDLRVGGAPLSWFERTPLGWEAAWRRYQELEVSQSAPSWRRAQPGWVLLHVVIGLVLWLVLFGVGLGLAAAFGRQVDDLEGLADDAQAAVGGGALLLLGAGVAGWILFVYLRKPLGVRWAALAGLAAAGLAGFLAVALPNLPRA